MLPIQENPVPRLETERLILRCWRESDIQPFVAMGQDPKVMENLGPLLSADETAAMAGRIHASFEQNGFGVFAVEVKGGPDFIGFIGLAIPRFEAPFTPCVEVGWRLAADHWGKGYAGEGAKRCLEFAFSPLDLTEIVALTAVGNSNSRRVMEKLAMTYEPIYDFEHPNVTDPKLKAHVLYRITKEQFLRRYRVE